MAELNKWGIERPHGSIITLIGCVSRSNEGKGIFLLAPPASRRYFGLADSLDTCFTQAMCASKFPDGKIIFLVHFVILVLAESRNWLEVEPWALISSFGIYKYSRSFGSWIRDENSRRPCFPKHLVHPRNSAKQLSHLVGHFFPTVQKYFPKVLFLVLFIAAACATPFRIYFQCLWTQLDIVTFG